MAAGDRLRARCSAGRSSRCRRWISPCRDESSACPISAACWSPAMPRIAIGAPEQRGGAERAGAVAHLRQHGARECRTAPADRRPSRRDGCRTAACGRRWWRRSRAPRRRSAATAGNCPPCRTPACPASAAARAPSTWSSSQRDLGRGEIRDRARRPVRAAISAPCPARSSRSQTAAVRRSCQTMALWIARPVRRSHTTTVSRWLVMPSAAMSAAASPAAASACRAVASTVGPDLLGIVFDPARPADRSAANSCWAVATGATAASNTMLRVDVVPWSMTRMCRAMAFLPCSLSPIVVAGRHSPVNPLVRCHRGCFALHVTHCIVDSGNLACCDVQSELAASPHHPGGGAHTARTR